ncbi:MULTISPECIES: methionine gamma-lyase [Providencia]|uniref:methionine gamma-lyase n=1 Tax=Providencia TaxID=586 RepID=UPI0008FB8F34|nr:MULTISPECIES: methionine gamma-lyase [Providencia]APC13162.1 Methionine gamma-lyase [Providencia rettgeri]AVL72546.1 methionine gamma-lyase [Providencia rettgeri]EIL1984042.1 methionine gamma-lyase [Providencia rettgeri]EIU9516564.1 methionine gamma-lyase [Providencia rettgeri]EJD6045116.1 methionine gamma-lyase [Providencia rettgeri]
MSLDIKSSFDTRAIHSHYDANQHLGSLAAPIYQTSTYVFKSVEEGGAYFSGEKEGYIYTRINNPTLTLLENRIASLEEAEAAVVFSSGMGAITATFWTLLNPGDELLVDLTVYGCTYAFFHHGLARFGVKVRHIDMSDPNNVAKAITDKTRIIFFESPANPNMRLVDIAAVSEIAHRKKVLVAVDNTYCTPYIQKPITLGADIVIHSLTKYMNGHGDAMGGAIATSAEYAKQVRLVGLKDMTGACLSPHDANLILRGVKTLPVRMERIVQNTHKIAEYLQSHPQIKSIMYPGLPNFEQYQLAQRQMKLAGGIIACELKGGIEAGKLFLNRLKLFSRAVSLGDCESLAQHPASMTHSTYTREERLKYGISDGLIRLSIGLENVDELIDDIRQAIEP